MTFYTDKHQAVVAMIQHSIDMHGYNMTDLERLTGITRSQLYRWINGDATNIQQKSFQSVAEALGYAIHRSEKGIEINRHKLKEKGGDMHNQTIEERYINTLEETNTHLKEKLLEREKALESLTTELNNNSSGSVHWEGLEHHFISDVTIHVNNFKFGRTVNSITNLNVQSQRLGYSEDELAALWDVGTKYEKMTDHPIDTILDKSSLDAIQKQIGVLPHIFNSMKQMVGDHYIPQPIIYVHKDGTLVPSIAFCKVYWREMKVLAKVQYFND